MYNGEEEDDSDTSEDEEVEVAGLGKFCLQYITGGSFGSPKLKVEFQRPHVAHCYSCYFLAVSSLGWRLLTKECRSLV